MACRPEASSTWSSRSADGAISKSEVSRIGEGLDESVGVIGTRALDHTTFTYVYLDTTYMHVRNELQTAWPAPGCSRPKTGRPFSSGVHQAGLPSKVFVKVKYPTPNALDELGPLPGAWLHPA